MGKMFDVQQSLSIATGIVFASLALGFIGSFGVRTGLSRIQKVTGLRAR